MRSLALAVVPSLVLAAAVVAQEPADCPADESYGTAGAPVRLVVRSGERSRTLRFEDAVAVLDGDRFRLRLPPFGWRDDRAYELVIVVDDVAADTVARPARAESSDVWWGGTGCFDFPELAESTGTVTFEAFVPPDPPSALGLVEGTFAFADSTGERAYTGRFRTETVIDLAWDSLPEGNRFRIFDEWHDASIGRVVHDPRHEELRIELREGTGEDAASASLPIEGFHGPGVYVDDWFDDERVMIVESFDRGILRGRQRIVAPSEMPEERTPEAFEGLGELDMRFEAPVYTLPELPMLEIPFWRGP